MRQNLRGESYCLRGDMFTRFDTMGREACERQTGTELAAT